MSEWDIPISRWIWGIHPLLLMLGEGVSLRDSREGPYNQSCHVVGLAGPRVRGDPASPACEQDYAAPHFPPVLASPHGLLYPLPPTPHVASSHILIFSLSCTSPHKEVASVAVLMPS